MQDFSRRRGFSLIELLISTSVMLIVLAGAMTTFRQALDINDAASQIADSSQNLRAGTNQLVRDLMMGGRIIAGGGVPAPNGSGALAIARPGPPGSALTFSFVADADGALNLPSITTGYQLGPTINGNTTDIVTILSVDAMMAPVQGIGSGTPTGMQGLIATDGAKVTLPSASPWLRGDTVDGTPAMTVGDLVLFKNENGMAVQTITSTDTTNIYFASNSLQDWFHFNQRSTTLRGTVYCIKEDAADPSKRGCDTMPVSAAFVGAAFPATALFRLVMTTYYVDNTTTVASPRLMRFINHLEPPQALAGVVEDLDLTYDLVDPMRNTTAGRPSLPYTDPVSGVVYSSNMIGKVNIQVTVRSELPSRATQTYVRNQISTSVDVRSLASVDRYNTQ